METYYIDNTSGSIRNLLLIENRIACEEFGSYDLAGTMPWVSAEKEKIDILVDHLSTKTSDCIEIYDSEGNIVASTHPVDPTERGNPGNPGEYLCRLEETEIEYGEKRKKFWMVLKWHGQSWDTANGWRVIRWLYLPRTV